MKLQANTTFVMIGDSVTDGAHARPVGDAKQGIGNSYAGIVDALIASTYHDLNCRVINAGTNGNTSKDLVARWDTDVLSFTPDWVSIMIGINDLWRQYDTPLDPSWHVGLEEYEQNLVTMIEKTLPVTKNILLLSPIFMELNKQDAVRADADAYSASMKRIAEQYGLQFVDVQACFDKYLQHIIQCLSTPTACTPTKRGTPSLQKQCLARWISIFAQIVNNQYKPPTGDV